VLASGEADDAVLLGQLLGGTPWSVLPAASADAALSMLRNLAIPIVLFARDLDGQPWQETLRRFLKTRRRACVIVLAGSCGPNAEEVLHRGGFDVLTRPLDKDDLFTALLCAYSQARMHWLSFTRVHATPAGAIS
jgi:CheY-like chemotaxis protein